MTKIIYSIIFGILISCTQKNKVVGTTDSLNTEQFSKTKDISDENTSVDETDCVFNNDYKGLTTEWLTELKIENFIWKVEIEKAVIPREPDTISVTKGGCEHLEILVEIKLTNDNHSMTDSLFFINKALSLATEFKLENYREMIKNGRFRKVQDLKSTVWYEIDDDDPEDNLFYNGIQITEYGQSKRINLTQYYN